MATDIWDYSNCKRTLTGDNDMRISYSLKDGLFSVNPYVCWSLFLHGFLVAAIGTAPGRGL